jgi:hypothetical protein
VLRCCAALDAGAQVVWAVQVPSEGWQTIPESVACHLTMRSAGISKKEWDEVVDLSARIANATIAADDALAKLFVTRLLRILDSLELKHGRLPSILATRADYTDDARKKIALFEEAWRLGTEREDRSNLVMIASSLAELHIEELNDASTGARWLARLETALENHWDDSEYQELQRLRNLVNCR